ncbi:MAG: hypothetical protein ACRD15_02725 [Vicinamibacterales bacterium]
MRLLLCVYLLGWVPLNYAIELLGAFPSLDMRGPVALVELTVHGLVAIVCAAAGWMLWVGSPSALPFAAFAVVAGGIATIQSLYWSTLPRQLAPGERLPLAALAAAWTVFWVVFIRLRRK